MVVLPVIGGTAKLSTSLDFGDLWVLLGLVILRLQMCPIILFLWCQGGMQGFMYAKQALYQQSYISSLAGGRLKPSLDIGVP